MNNKKNIFKFFVTALACTALCGGAFAAPGPAKGRAPGKAPAHQKAPTARHAPAPRHHEPPPREPHHGHHTIHTEGWVTIGAALLGGLVGGLCN